MVLKKGKTNPLNTKINKPVFRSATWLTQIPATGSYGASPCAFNGQVQPLLFTSCCSLWHINTRPYNYSSQGKKSTQSYAQIASCGTLDVHDLYFLQSLHDNISKMSVPYDLYDSS